jgi:hypothetical protein
MDIPVPHIEKFAEWMYDQDLTSRDPFDIQSTKTAHSTAKFVKKYPAFEKIKGIAQQLNQKHPKIIKLFIKRKKSATSVALFASSSFILHELTNNIKWKKRGIEAVLWLEENSSKGYSGYCWGLPFDWQMSDSIFAKAGTPYSTIIIYMTDAFISAYNRTGDQRYLDIALSSADFFIKDLPRTYEDENSICMSYSPLDRFRVVNVNSYAAVNLYITYSYTNILLYKTVADKLIQFVLDEQNPDGSWYYWAKSMPINQVIDSLHQCYIIQNLYRCYLINKSEKVKKAIVNGLTFFQENFYDNGKITKYPMSKNNHKDTSIVELIDAAEALNMFTMLQNSFDTKKLTDETLDYAIKHFTIPGKNYYYSSILKGVKLDQNYIRWGESQMLNALCKYVLAQKGNQ